MRKFKTESQKLLDLMINSIYTNREIFLRELISNASDAVDKLYFRSLVDDSVSINRSDLAITVGYDETARTVSVSDNGIGMTKDELDKNLGTIAHSDSMEFKAANAEGASDVDIIGQFGVGFYSSFMVGRSVRVVSRAYGSDEAWAWESDGIAGYTISPATRDEHGTDVIITLKENTDDEYFDTYATEHGLRELIKRYSNYVRYPIQMKVTLTRQLPKPEDAGDDWRPQYESYEEIQVINSMVPIWKRSSGEVTQEEYNEFYKTDFHDFEDPARTITLHAEGALTYDALLFVPSRAPYDLYTRDYKKGLALYSSNVLIMDKCEELVPDYFSFVRGVVDSADLTLNISRETLQHNAQLRAIARRIEKKVKTDLADMRDNDREAYEKFFKNFGRTIKYGLYTSYGMAKDVIGDLLLFYSAKEKKMITLDEYLAAAPDDQNAIYYAIGESVDHLARMPIVTTVLAKGYDVLLCTEDVDEFCFMALRDYGGVTDENGAIEGAKPLKNVSGEDLGLTSEDEQKAADEATAKHEGLFEAMAKALEDKVDKVVVSTRVSDAPAILTTEGPISLQMAHMLRNSPGDEGTLNLHAVMELNAQHPVFSVLNDAFEAGDSDKVADYTKLLYDQALLVEGLPIDDPVAFAQSVAKLMV